MTYVLYACLCVCKTCMGVYIYIYSIHGQVTGLISSKMNTSGTVGYISSYAIGPIDLLLPMSRTRLFKMLSTDSSSIVFG